ncbi:MAG: hypothetical protein SFU83_08785 [Meiothermus sp.]|nr:hypothetical protein [Meiothermus sp.]
MRHVGLLGLVALLGACVPQNTPPPNPNVPSTRIETTGSFYPLQTSFEWIYLPDRAGATDPSYRLTILGQGSFNNQVVTRYRFFGRGQDRIYYRQVDASGVRMLGFEEVVTETVTRFDPPIQEYPAQANLIVGARWGGISRFTTDLRAGGRTTRFAEGQFEYTYTVLGRANVSVQNNTYQVFRIGLERKTPASGPNPAQTDTAEIWFVPNVGEVRTQEGLQLLDRNFK